MSKQVDISKLRQLSPLGSLKKDNLEALAKKDRKSTRLNSSH